MPRVMDLHGRSTLHARRYPWRTDTPPLLGSGRVRGALAPAARHRQHPRRFRRPPPAARLPLPRVLAPDLPGHGRSPALPQHHTIAAITDAVAADLDELGVARVHVLGNSIGARVAVERAARGRASSV